MSRCGENSVCRWVYSGLSTIVFGVKYVFCLFLYSGGKFLSICFKGPGFGSMSPHISSNRELCTMWYFILFLMVLLDFM